MCFAVFPEDLHICFLGFIRCLYFYKEAGGHTLEENMCLLILVLFAFTSSGVTLFSSSCPWLITHKTVKFESKVTCRDGGVGSIL